MHIGGLRWILTGLFAVGAWTQPVKVATVQERIEEVRKGQAFVIEEVLLPPKDSAHDYYPVIRIYRGGTLVAEVTPEMLSEVMSVENCLTTCGNLPESEKRICFGKCIRGPIQYFSLNDPGTEVDVMVETDAGVNKTYQTFTIDLDPPHQVLLGWSTNGSSVSRGIPSPWDSDENPNYEEWFFYAYTVTSRGDEGVRLEVAREGFWPPNHLLALRAADVGAPTEAVRVDFEKLKWVGFKELEFEWVAFGLDANGEEFELKRERKVFDVVDKKFVAPTIKPKAKMPKATPPQKPKHRTGKTPSTKH